MSGSSSSIESEPPFSPGSTSRSIPLTVTTSALRVALTSSSTKVPSIVLLLPERRHRRRLRLLVEEARLPRVVALDDDRLAVLHAEEEARARALHRGELRDAL